jgi:hypothetical protein
MRVSLLAFCALLSASRTAAQHEGECVCTGKTPTISTKYCQDNCNQGAFNADFCDCAVVSVKQPQAFALYLRKAVAGISCDQKFSVWDSVYGTLANDGVYLDGRGIDWPLDDPGGPRGVALSWLSDHNAMDGFLTNEATGCCRYAIQLLLRVVNPSLLCCSANVTTLQQCKCKIGTSVGLWASDADCDTAGNYSYYGLIPEQTDDLSPHVVSPEDSVYVTAPTWTNIVAAMPFTYEMVFANFPGGAAALGLGNCTAAQQAELVAKLSSFSDGKDSWRAAVIAGAATAGALGADFQPTGVSNVTVARYGAFLQAPSAAAASSSASSPMCTDAMAVRTYLWWALDANSEFLGTGDDTSGNPEFVTMLNPSVMEIQGGCNGCGKTDLFALQMQDKGSS